MEMIYFFYGSNKNFIKESRGPPLKGIRKILFKQKETKFNSVLLLPFHFGVAVSMLIRVACSELLFFFQFHVSFVSGLERRFRGIKEANSLGVIGYNGPRRASSFHRTYFLFFFIEKKVIKSFFSSERERERPGHRRGTSFLIEMRVGAAARCRKLHYGRR